MKIFFLFALFAFLILFSYSCSPKAGPVNTMPSGAASTAIGIDPQLLCQPWVHSREEQQPSDKDELYRPQGFKQFPPSHFRMQYVFHPNGECEWLYLSPNDAHHMKAGKWRIDPNNKPILQISKEGATESYRVSELTKDRLRMARIN